MTYLHDIHTIIFKVFLYWHVSVSNNSTLLTRIEEIGCRFENTFSKLGHCWFICISD